MIAAISIETLAFLLGIPLRQPSMFDGIGTPLVGAAAREALARQPFIIDLGEADVDFNVDTVTVTLTGNGHEHTLEIPPRPPGRSYVSIDPGTGAITTVVGHQVVYRGPPDPGMRKLFEVSRADGMTRHAGRPR